MGETLTQQRRVEEEGFRIVNSCPQGRAEDGEESGVENRAGDFRRPPTRSSGLSEGRNGGNGRNSESNLFHDFTSFLENLSPCPTVYQMKPDRESTSRNHDRTRKGEPMKKTFLGDLL